MTGPQEANCEYEDKLKAGNAMDKIILSLAWKVEDLKKLSEIGREILRKIGAIVEDAGGDEADCVWPIFRFNLPHCKKSWWISGRGSLDTGGNLHPTCS